MPKLERGGLNLIRGKVPVDCRVTVKVTVEVKRSKAEHGHNKN